MSINLFQIFSPAGWDNEKKMAILHETMTSFKPDAYYNDVIPKPLITRKVNMLNIKRNLAWHEMLK